MSLSTSVLASSIHADMDSVSPPLSAAGMHLAQTVSLFSNKYISLVRGGIGGAELTLSGESLSVMAVKVIDHMSVCTAWCASCTIIPKDAASHTTISSTVALSVPAVEVQLTVAGINMYMI